MEPWTHLALTQRTLGARVFLFVFPMIPSAETKSLQLLSNLLERFWVRGRDSDRLLVTSMMPNTNLLVLPNYSQPLWAKKEKKRPKRCNCIGFKPAVRRKNYPYFWIFWLHIIKVFFFFLKGNLLNLNADTVIQYFGNSKKSKEIDERTEEVIINSSNTQERARHKDKNGIKFTNLENMATIKNPERSQVERILNAVLSTKLKGNLSQRGANRNATHFTVPKQEQPSKSQKMALFTSNTKKPHSSRKSQLSEKIQNQDSESKVSDQITAFGKKENFNFDNWYKERTTEICGTGWQENYRKLHEEILSKRREEKYLVYLCPGTRQGCCGYGNRRRAVVSLFYLSILTDRAFLIDWRAPEPIENHLLPRTIQWNYSEPIDLCTGLPIRKHYWGTTGQSRK